MADIVIKFRRKKEFILINEDLWRQIGTLDCFIPVEGIYLDVKPATWVRFKHEYHSHFLKKHYIENHHGFDHKKRNQNYALMDLMHNEGSY